jgi:hypothetical protein
VSALDDEVTLGELGRMLVDLKADVRSLRGEYLRADVYSANQAVLEVRLRAVEASLAAMHEGRTAMTRLVYSALVMGIGSLVVQLIVTALNHKP